jgi:hypothetical protein
MVSLATIKDLYPHITDFNATDSYRGGMIKYGMYNSFSYAADNKNNQWKLLIKE